MTAELVAVAVTPGPAWVDVVRRIWDDGDAVFPVDRRLPSGVGALQFDAVAPGAVIEDDGERRSLGKGRATEPGDAVVVVTSGTTGAPRGIVHTHASISASARATSAALGVDPAADRWLCCLPLAHVGGLSVVLRSIVTGTPVVVHDGFDAGAVDRAATEGATLVSLVTRALVQVDTTGFRRILLGGGPMPPERPANTVATYGMTETGSGVVYEGRPLDGVEVRIADDGEIHLRCPMLARATRDGVPLAGPDGWYATGDDGAWNDDGTVRVHGRRGGVVVTGGEKVWPEQVEPVLAGVPGVAEVAIAGRPDPEWGRRLVAVVVAAPGAAVPGPEQLARVTDEAGLPSWCRPREVVRVGSLPRTALGKIRRAALDELLDGGGREPEVGRPTPR